MVSVTSLCGRELRKARIGLRRLKSAIGHRQIKGRGIGHRSSRGWRVLLLAGTALLAGCSLSPYVMQSSLDYNETIESLTNSLLVTNILRARDFAPLYFSDVPLIRGAVSVSGAGQATWPFGPVQNSTSRNSATAGPLTVTTNPGWDFAPLNTKNFAQGVLGGINPNQFAYFFDRGFDAATLLNLVVRRVEKYQPTGSNDGAEFKLVQTFEPTFRRPNPAPGNPHQPQSLEQLIRKWGAAKTTIRVVKSSTFGPSIPAEAIIYQKDPLINLVQVSTAGLELKESKDKSHYQLSKSSNKYVLCVSSSEGIDAVGIESPGVGKAPSEAPIPKDAKADPKDAKAGPKGAKADGPSVPPCSQDLAEVNTRRAAVHEPPTRVNKERYVLVLRSVEEMFYYLGAVLRAGEGAPIDLHIDNYPSPNSRLRVFYRGETYFVRDQDTMAILAILNDLLNLNRDANEIPTTKTVATTSP